MFDQNLTVITRVILLGFQGSPLIQMVLFSVFLVIYCVTMCGNLQIISLVSSSKTLHTPMYFFLSHLSISDILLSSDIVPSLLHVLLYNPGTMSFSSCMAQFYVFLVTEGFECLLLTVMSYDRYVAICNPLLYNTVMKHDFCLKIVFLSWFFSITPCLVELITIYNLWFCGPNIIDHFFCDMEPLLNLSCSDISLVYMEIILASFPILIFPCGSIIISYVYIIYNILRISSSTGRQKAFSTCSAHLTVVSIFYGTLFSNYIIPKEMKSGNMTKFLALLYTVVTPLINPIIYCLRNKEIKAAFDKSIQKFHLKFIAALVLK